MYEEVVNSVERVGVRTDITGLLYSESLEAILEQDCNKYQLKKALAPKLENILNKTKENLEDKLSIWEGCEHLPKELEGFLAEKRYDLAVVETALKRYWHGKSITINGLRFCNADRAPEEKINYKMFPSLNFLSNGLFYAGMVPYFLGLPIYLLSGNAIPIEVGATCICTGFGSKFIGKAIKSLFKKLPLKALYYSAVGLGGLSLAASSNMFHVNLNNSTLSYVAALSAYTFNIHLFVKFLKTIFAREKITEPLPFFGEVNMDLETQIKRYNEVKKRYKNIAIRKIPTTPKSFIEEIQGINKYLKYYLKKGLLKRIDVDIDNFIGKILPAAAHADPFTNTAEFCTKAYYDKKGQNKLTAGLFAKIYSHEIMHLNGIMNEGKANYLADKVLEDLAINRQGQGYDLQLERDRLIAVGHVYSLYEIYRFLKSNGDRIKDKMCLGLVCKNLIKRDLQQKKVGKSEIESILKWVFPGKISKYLFKAQSIMGGSNPLGGYTIDCYKLLKDDTTFVR